MKILRDGVEGFGDAGVDVRGWGLNQDSPRNTKVEDIRFQILVLRCVRFDLFDYKSE